MENKGFSSEIRYCLYARKSSEEDEKQALSIEAQENEMTIIANRDGLNVVCIKKEAHSAKASGKRPIFNEIIQELRLGKFDGILTWNTDRLSRNAGDLGSVIDLIDGCYLKEIRTYNQNFKNTPNDKFLLTILGGQAKLENDNKSINVRRGLKIKTDKGYWIGVAPIGYINTEKRDEPGVVYRDPERADTIIKMFEKVAYENYSGRALYGWLKDSGFRSKNGKILSLSNVYDVLARPFYYGWFEYPKKSGNWCKGQHEPLITKELFTMVQKKIKSGNSNPYRQKEFMFIKLLVCGNCGSNICGIDKYKNLKDGTTKKYIYYGCNRNRDKQCKNLYIREDNLIDQIVRVINDINIPEEEIKEKLKVEIDRYNHLQKQVLKMNNIEIDEENHKKINLTDYAKFILNHGSIEEKRQFISMFKNRFIMKDKKISLIKN